MAIDPIINGDDNTRAKINAAIEKANLVDGKAEASALAAEIAARQDLDLHKADREAAADAQIAPGEFPTFWTVDVDTAVSPAPLAPNLAATDSDGRVIRATTASKFAPIALMRIEPGRRYKARFAFRRRTNSPDPANDGVRLAVRWFTQSKTPVADPAGTTVLQDVTTLTAGSGRQAVTFVLAREAGAGVDLIAPTGARYGRPFIQTFGLGSVTDIEVIDFVDITDAALFSPDLGDFDARLSAQESLDAGNRLDYLESVAGDPEAMTLANIGTLEATAVAALVQSVTLLSGEADGDGLGGIYRRAAGTTVIQSLDGAYWEEINPLVLEPDEPTAIAGLNARLPMSARRTKQSIDANAPDAAFLTDIANPNIFPMSARDRAKLGWNLLEFIHPDLRAAIKDGSTTTAVTTRIQEAFDSGEILTAPRGLFLIDGPLDDYTGITLRGAGRGKTIFRLPDKNLNGLCLRADNFDISGITVDLVHKDDTATGSCILFFSTENGLLFDAEARNGNRQGITGNPISSKLLGLWSINCGHRGFNFSQGANANVFTNIHAIDCGFSGFLLGFDCNRNIGTGIRVKGFEKSPGFIVEMSCSENVFSDVVISDPTSASNPHMLVGAASADNLFSGFILKGVNNRGLNIRNQNLTDPPATDLGLVNAPNARNVFRDFKILGDGTAASTGIYMDEVVGEEHGIDADVFDQFYIDGVANAVRDVTGTATNCKFNSFTFGTISGSRWMMPAGKGHRARDVSGVNWFGSLVSGGFSGNIPAHPTYATGTAFTNTYPFPVMITITGQAGTGAGTLVDGVATTVSLGNGIFTLGPGQTIEPRQGSTGTGSWRWFGLG